MSHERKRVLRGLAVLVYQQFSVASKARSRVKGGPSPHHPPWVSLLQLPIQLLTLCECSDSVWAQMLRDIDRRHMACCERKRRLSMRIDVRLPVPSALVAERGSWFEQDNVPKIYTELETGALVWC